MFDEMINGEEKLNLLSICTEIGAEFDFLIKKLNDKCMDSAERTILQLELNSKKVELIAECMKLIKG